MALSQVVVAEPLERPVHRHDLDHRLHFRIVRPPVPRLVGVRDDQHVLGGIPGAQALVQPGQRGRYLRSDAPCVWRTEEDVVVPAPLSPQRPLIAEERYEFARNRVALDGLSHGLPFEVVQPDVVLGQPHEVQAGVLAGEPVRADDRSLSLRHAGMRVSLAPVQAVRRIPAHPHGVAQRLDPAVRAGDLETVDAFLVEADGLDHLQRVAACVQGPEAPAIERDRCARHGCRGPIAVAVLPADRQVELFAGLGDRGHDRRHPFGARAHDLKGRPARRQEIARAVQVDVDRQHRLIGGECLQAPALRSGAAIAVHDRHGVSALERALLHLEGGHGRRAPEAAVHPHPGE